MLLKSEKVKLILVEHLEGEGKNGNYNYNKLYYDLESGRQENIIIKDDLLNKVKKQQYVYLILEKKDKYINLIDFEEVK